jgi:hypothetical protein
MRALMLAARAWRRDTARTWLDLHVDRRRALERPGLIEQAAPGRR